MDILFSILGLLVACIGGFLFGRSAVRRRDNVSGSGDAAQSVKGGISSLDDTSQRLASGVSGIGAILRRIQELSGNRTNPPNGKP